jgi:hypothetical protein
MVLYRHHPPLACRHLVACNASRAVTLQRGKFAANLCTLLPLRRRDVGYTLPSIQDVLDLYATSYFPLAVNTRFEAAQKDFSCLHFGSCAFPLPHFPLLPLPRSPRFPLPVCGLVPART